MILRDIYGLVTINSLLPDTKTYYTLDGTEPSQKSLKYDKPFEQVSSANIKAIAFIKGTKSSTTVTNVSQLLVLNPIINPKNVYFVNSVAITLTSLMSGTETRYTLDGSEPIETSLLYKSSIKIEKTSTLKLRAFKKAHKPSAIISSKYQLVIPGQGLQYKYYVGRWEQTPNYIELTADKTGVIGQFNLEEIETNKDYYALLLIGFINIEETGEYIFYCGSNDGTKLYINNKLLIDNDGGHGYQEKDGKINLDKGQHKIEVRYFQQGGGQELKVFWQGKEFKKREITKLDLSNN